MGLWILERGSDETNGSKVEFKSAVRLRSLCTGKYIQVQSKIGEKFLL
jgi:hypothetical protein